MFDNKNINIGRLILTLFMTLVVVAGGTFAWFTYQSRESALVLTIGDINDTQIKLTPYQIQGTMTPVNTYTSGVYSEVEVTNGSRNTSVHLYYKINQLDKKLIDNGLAYTIVDTNTGNTVKTGYFSDLIDTSKTLPEEVIILDKNTVVGSTNHYKVYLWLDSSKGNQTEIQNSVLDVELNGSIGSIDITGTNTYGQTLSAKLTDNSNNNLYTYQWYSNSSNSTSGGSAISGATSNTYVISSGLVGKYIYVVATSSDGSRIYSDITDTENNNSATVNRKDATLTVNPKNINLTYPNVDSSTLSYTYDGDGTVSCNSVNTSIVTCSVDTSTKKVTVTPKASTTSSTTISLSATQGTNYNTTTSANITVNIAKGTMSAGVVTISGDIIPGKTLTATINTDTNPKADTYKYQWYANSTNSTSGGSIISGATSGTYVIGNDYVGKYIYVIVTAEKSNYNSVTFSDITDSKVEEIANQITATDKTIYVNQTQDISALVSNVKGSLTYKIKSQTTTGSSLSGKTLTAGVLSASIDDNGTVVVTVTDDGGASYTSSSVDVTITVQKYTRTLTWDSSTPSSVTYGDTSKKATVTVSGSGGTQGAVSYSSNGTSYLTVNSSTGALTPVAFSEGVTITATLARTTTVKQATSTKSIAVARANGNITLSANKSVTYGTASTTFTVSSHHGGTLSVEDPSGTPTASVSGSTVTVANIGADAAGSTVSVTVTSGQTAQYNAASATYTLTIDKATLSGGSVSITGTNTVGSTLTASVVDTTPTATYTYQWYANSSNSTTEGTAISGATSSTFKLTSSQVGKYVYVIVKASKTNYIDKTFADVTDVTANKFAVVKNVATIPTNSYCNSLTYNGSSQILTKTAGTGYTFSNNTRTNAGSQDVTATLSTDYVWNDNTTGTKTISCTIEKATPTITLGASSGTVVAGKTITFTEKASVAGKFTNTSGKTSVATVAPGTSSSEVAANTNATVTVTGVASGSSTITVTFTPTDTTNYNSITSTSNGGKTYTVTVASAATIPTASSHCNSLTYNGSSQILTKTAGTGYTFSNNTRTNAGSQTVTATLASGYRWSDDTTGTQTFNCSIAKASCTCSISVVPTLKHPGTPTGNITYSCGGDGTRSVVSETTSVITVGSVGTTSTPLTALNSGTSKITVSQAEGTNYNVCSSDSKDVTVSLTTYTVTYNANGGSGAPAAQTKTHGTDLTLSTTKPTRTNYVFLGWHTSSSATSAMYAAGGKYTSNASITLYAVWASSTYNVNFNTNGGNFETEVIYTTVGEHTYTVPLTGQYKLEVWGGQGGSANSTYVGGYGGYSTGTVSLTAGTNLYVNVGGTGTGATTSGVVEGGYNGGGDSYVITTSCSNYGGSGGGASHIATTKGELPFLSQYAGNNNSPILIVAGGGGGSIYRYCSSSDTVSSSGGNGGGYIGTSSLLTSNTWSYTLPTGGSQASGGTGGTSNGESGATNGAFGQGANYSRTGGYSSSGAGGGGYYGGGLGSFIGGGGGSGYIGNSTLTNKAMYCYNCTTSSNSNTLTYSTTNVSGTPTANYAKSGDGAAKIAALSSSSSMQITYGQKYGSLPIPTRDGYIFEGWYTSSTGGTKVTNDTLVSIIGEHTLYAQWRSGTYNLNLNANGGKVETSINQVYSTVGEHTYIVPDAGEYKLEVWGAQGGGSNGGYGGYSIGVISLDSGKNLYINVGGTSTTGTGGYNGGGSVTGNVYGGGGATHIATASGLLSSLSSNKDSVLIVGGGGGGSGNGYSGGGGGGFEGVKGTGDDYGFGGTQNSGGGVYSSSCGSSSGSFGIGGSGSWVSESLGGGGGGYYGGGSGGGCNNNGSGGGGSGYIGSSLLTSKAMYCYNCTISSNADTLTYSTTNVSANPVANYAKSGDGAAKITTLSSLSSKQITYGKKYGSLPTPTKDGYIFLGWYTAPDGGTQVTDDTLVSITEEHTLYAQWKKKIYTLYVYNAGDENTTITGGWSNIGPSNSYWSFGQVNKYSNSIRVHSATDYWYAEYTSIATGNKIDLTNYNKLYVNVTAVEQWGEYGYGSYIDFLTARIYAHSTSYIVKSFHLSKTGLLEFDVSSLSGEYYIGIHNATEATATSSVTFDSIYLKN